MAGRASPQLRARLGETDSREAHAAFTAKIQRAGAHVATQRRLHLQEKYSGRGQIGGVDSPFFVAVQYHDAVLSHIVQIPI
jgi:hypothetical protein